MVIAELVEKFELYHDTYTSDQYNEAQVRKDFVDVLFKALGWDLDNVQGLPEGRRDTISEDKIRVGNATKFPDYSFGLNGSRKFFVETKKPSVNLADDPGPALQLRTYAWNADLTLSILTDFEEFAVYDCRFKPQKNDGPDKGQIRYLTYRDYLDRWDEIADIFSKEAVSKGSLDRYAEEKRSIRGTKKVNEAFLEEISAWRDSLARNIAIRNPDLSVEDLNVAVQNTIDRIIFLRICEDRGIERYEQLKEISEGSAGAGIYARLGELFRHADSRYNSGLFHFQADPERAARPDLFTLNLKIDDKPLKEIISSLYPPGPYNFAVMPPEILGQVYEQFLGKVIRLTEGHRAKVEDKPEVRKAGGVFYTPSYIVEYIVENTVGKLLEGKTPRTASDLRILDPACGSGSFLLGAYKYLLDWHLEWYSKSLRPFLEAGEPETSSIIRKMLPTDFSTDAPDDEKRKGRNGRRKKRRQASSLPIFKGAGDVWRLTTEEKKRILLNNICGVDIDPQAVEVTKLSLLLKVLEGESQETIQTLQRFSDERALPDLDNNIKCGNSLIGFEFIEEHVGLSREEIKRVNPFDWEYEFADIMREGGFDAVIGNPPYIRIQTIREWAPLEVEDYKKKYVSARKGNYDIYVVFVEKGLSLMSEHGKLGFILPHKFLNAKYGEPLRGLISSGKNLSTIVYFGDQQVFEGATTYTCLLFLNKIETHIIDFIKVEEINDWKSTWNAIRGKIISDDISSDEWNLAVGDDSNIFNKLAKMPVKLGQISHIFVGLQTSADNVFLFKGMKKSNGPLTSVKSKALEKSIEVETALLKLVVRSGEIGRYWASPSALVLFPYKQDSGKVGLITEEEMAQFHPFTWAYLNANYKLLSEREHGKFSKTGWYQLYPKNLDTWEQPKIMLPYMITRLSAFYDEAGYYFVNVTTGGFGITVDESKGHTKYIVGLINSRLLDWFLKHVSTTFHGGYFAANKQFLVQLPIRVINFSDPADIARHNRMVALVEQMLQLHKRLAEARTGHEQNLLQRQIEATDKQIDRLVYELYGLSEEEIRIVEGNGPG